MPGLQSVMQAFSKDGTAVGTTLKSVSPNVAEALGHTPLDFLFIDRQHGSPVSEQLEHILRAADINDLPVIVRVPKGDTSMITYLLDLGVAGIMLPQIEDPNEVIEASTHVRYHDGRSIATTSRAADFGAQSRDEYLEYVNEEVALIPQLESETGVQMAKDIALLQETSAIAIGPGDLSMSLGVAPGNEVLSKAIEEVFIAANNEGCGVGIFVGNKEDIDSYESDAAFTIYNSDVGLLINHFNSVLSD